MGYSRMHRLTTSLWLPLTREAAWEFFSVPENLGRITPPEMDFRIRSGGGMRTHAGQIIVYRVSPVAGIPTSWVTEISHVVEGEYFVDEQRFGPYAFWHHLHRFTPEDGGVRMDDVLHYRLPFGLLGALAGALFVHSKVRSIFAYRTEALQALFPGTRPL
jgi:ligand-binding SRPBCC domain-containing protein